MKGLLSSSLSRDAVWKPPSDGTCLACASVGGLGGFPSNTAKTKRAAGGETGLLRPSVPSRTARASHPSLWGERGRWSPLRWRRTWVWCGSPAQPYHPRWAPERVERGTRWHSPAAKIRAKSGQMQALAKLSGDQYSIYNRYEIGGFGALHQQPTTV